MSGRTRVAGGQRRSRGPESVAGAMEDDDSYGEWGPAVRGSSVRFRRRPASLGWGGGRGATGGRSARAPG